MKILLILSTAFLLSCLNNNTTATITTHHGVWMEEFDASFDSVQVIISVDGIEKETLVFNPTDLDDSKIRYTIVAPEGSKISTVANIFSQGKMIAKQLDSFDSGSMPEIPKPFLSPIGSVKASLNNQELSQYPPLSPIDFSLTLSASNNTILKIIWDFTGDATKVDTTDGSQTKYTYAYDQVGTFKVKITLIDDKGLTTTLQENINIVIGSLAFTKTPEFDTISTMDFYYFKYYAESENGSLKMGLDLDLNGRIDTVKDWSNQDFLILAGNDVGTDGSLKSGAEYKIKPNTLGLHQIPILLQNQFSSMYDTLEIFAVEPFTQAIANNAAKIVFQGGNYSTIPYLTNYDTLKISTSDTVFFFGNFEIAEYLVTLRAWPETFYWDFDNDGIWDDSLYANNLAPAQSPSRINSVHHVFENLVSGETQKVIFGLLNQYSYLSKDTVYLKVD